MLLVKRFNRPEMLFLLLVGAFVLHSPAYGDYYKYMDNRGTICITNNLNSIPRKYRATMKVIREEMPAKMDKGKQPQTPLAETPTARESATPENPAPAGPSSQAESRFTLLAGRFAWIRPLLIIAGIATAFLALFKLRPLITSPQLARLFTIVIFLGFFLFAYKLYADHLAAGYFTVKKNILDIFAKSNSREAPENDARARDLLEGPAR